MMLTYSTIETAHVPVRNTVAIDNLFFDHLEAGFGRFLLINPIRLEPMIMGNLSVGSFRPHNLRSPPDQWTIRVRRSAALVVPTYFLNSSVNGSSFKNT
jgi:hypothetical protein